jgi:3-methyladenine DNA glycosylase AlkD
MNSQAYFAIVRASFEDKSNPEYAEKQIAYMKHHFNFYGLKMAKWSELTKEIHKAHGIHDAENLQELITLCFDEEYRELQYFAMETFEKHQKKLGQAALPILEYMITHKSWWDSVDWIAKLVGRYFVQYPQEIIPTTSRWMASDSFWLQRVSIIFQLFFKEKTDFDLMTKYILQVKGSKEFFLNKACGWALRQYSRTNPDAVIAFVQANPDLAGLTRREALRLLK